MKDFKRGYVHAIANIIDQLNASYAQDCTMPGEVLYLPSELVLAWKGKGWSWDELIDAGVHKQDMVVLEHHQKQLGLGPRPVPPKGDHD